MSIESLIKKADDLLRNGDVYGAFLACKEAVNIARRRNKVTDDALLAYNNFVILRMKLANSKNELMNVKNNALEFLRISKKAKHRSDFYAIACFHVGNVMMALGEYEEAAKYLEEAMIIFEILDNKEGLMVSSKRLSEAYEELGLKEKAKMYASRAKAIAEELGDKESLRDMEITFKVWKLLPWDLTK